MDKEGSTEDITSSLSGDELDRDTLAIQNEEQGEPSKDMKSLSISSGSLKLKCNHGEDKLVDKMDMSGNLSCKDQGEKLATGQGHIDMGGNSNNSRDSKYKTQERELNSNNRQKNLSEENRDNDQGDNLENDRGHRDIGEKSNGSRDSKYKTQERELDLKKGQKNPADKVKSNAKDETLDNDQRDKLENDQSYRGMGGKNIDNRDSKYNTQVLEVDSKKDQKNPDDEVESNAKKVILDNDQGDNLENGHCHRDMGGKSSDCRDSKYKTRERELDSKNGQKNPDDKVESKAKEENLNNEGKYLESEAQEETNKVSGVEKEPEPVDGTEVSGMEAHTSMSICSLDHDSETPGVVEKAVSLKKFIEVKSVVAVTSFLSRFSGNRNEGGTDVADDGDRTFSDSMKNREGGDASQKTLEGSAWNPLSFIKTYQDVDGINKAEDANDESAQPITMKGRIILYTRLGCQGCRDARLFLYWKKLRYTEINIDVYPSRKQELEKFSGSSTVPKVFFNEVLIGGLSELKGLEDSGKLDEKIDYLVSEAPSFEAPLPPLSGEDDISNRGAIDELALIVLKMKEFVVVKDRFYKMRRFTKSFSGSEAVDFLSEDQYLEREEAIEFGRKLASQLFFQHVLEENLFEDGNHLYRFLDDDPVVSQCHNIPKGIIDVKPKPIVQIESRLRFIMCAILEAYVSEDGKHIDYRSIHGSEEFARYLRTVEELHRVELQHMRREDKLAFFINLYNMMAIHAILVWGHPDGSIERRKLFGDFKYVIGGSAYSLSDIQNGILRGNQRPPYNLMKPFSPKDKRAMMALPYAEPLIHFVLVFGTRSGPVLQCYSPGDIDQELMEAARGFLRNGGLIIDFDTKVASATKILKWFSIDFGKNEMEVLKHSSNYLEPAISEALLELLAISQLKENGLLFVPKGQVQNPQAQMFSDPNMAMDMKKNLSMVVAQAFQIASPVIQICRDVPRYRKLMLLFIVGQTLLHLRGSTSLDL